MSTQRSNTGHAQLTHSCFPLIFPHVFPARFFRSFFPLVFPARFPALYAVLFVLGLNSDSLLALISSALIGLCDDFGRSFTTFIESKSAPLYNHLNVFLPTVINLHTNRCVRTIGKVRWQHAEGRVLLLLNPFTSKISLETLLTVCNTVLMLLVWRIWYWIS